MLNKLHEVVTSLINGEPSLVEKVYDLLINEGVISTSEKNDPAQGELFPVSPEQNANS